MAWSVLLLSTAVSAHAQQCESDLDGFRVKVDTFVADLFAASDLAIQQDRPAAVDFQGAVVELDDSLAEITDDDLYELCLFFERIPTLNDTPVLLSDVLKASSNGPDWLPCLEPAAQMRMLGVVFAAEMVAGTAETVADVTNCWDKFGAVCTVMVTLAHVARSVEAILEGILELHEYACLEDHDIVLAETEDTLADVAGNMLDLQRGINDNLDVQVSTRASQTRFDAMALQLTDLDATLGTPRTASITGDIAAISADLADQEADREAYQRLKQRLTIELQLMHGVSGEIASLRLPSAFGGQLEAVRETVATAITMHINAGQTINNAMHYFDIADDHFNGGNYREAFDNYKLAYQQAVMLSSDK